MNPATDLATSARVAIDATLSLQIQIASFQSKQQRVRDLYREIRLLCEALVSLKDSVAALNDVSGKKLKHPLICSARACRDFENEIVHMLSHSGRSRADFRDWGRLQYLNEGMDEFQRLVECYRLTISVALADASLKASHINAARQCIDTYISLADTAKAGLEDRLSVLKESMDTINKGQANSEFTTRELEICKEEQESVNECLSLCTHASRRFGTLAATLDNKSDSRREQSRAPEQLTEDERLQHCEEHLAVLSQHLAMMDAQQFDRFKISCGNSTSSDKDSTSSPRAQDISDTIRRVVTACGPTYSDPNNEVSIIDNDATGDVIQLMVSTDGKTIRGRNRGHGWRVRQIGGHINPDTLRDIMTAIESLRDLETQDEAPLHESRSPDEQRRRFREHYGSGMRL